MKKILILLAFTFSLSVLGQGRYTPRNPLNKSHLERKYLALSFSADASNLLVGGNKDRNGVRRNPRALDFIVRGMVGDEFNRYSGWEFGVAYESFKAIEYQSLGMDLNLVLPLTRDLVFLLGGEAKYIARYGLPDPSPNTSTSLEFLSYGINLRVRKETLFKTPLFLEAQLNNSTRPDIKYFYGNSPNFKDSFSGYLGVGLKF